MAIEEHMKSLAWALGFVAFLIPSAVPSWSKYRGDISFYILMGFTSSVSMHYFALYYWRNLRMDKTSDEESLLTTLDEALLYPAVLEEGNAGK